MFVDIDISVAVMRETLRLAPSAPMRAVTSLEETTLKNGTYAISKDQTVLMNNFIIHRDPKVWGEDVRKYPPFDESSSDG